MDLDASLDMEDSELDLEVSAWVSAWVSVLASTGGGTDTDGGFKGTLGEKNVSNTWLGFGWHLVILLAFSDAFFCATRKAV
jgi:hypothetical protein